ncbi:glycosyltransferase family 64 protein C4-like [Phoenix dactylifera]|uniref:Glycosyltransferase family 64 protein C4-like n=1 Tax=Phoenix dactylifera TaxID=42345 RepID=A0A8B7BTY4_PHODC|nr:glycosyltransferase family 64 protein C4-like [Phoenix dactylifera]
MMPSSAAATMRGSALPLSSGRRIPLKFRHLSISAVGSVEIRLLLCCCVALAFLLLAFGYRHRPSHPPSLPPPGKGYTILINTWKRNDLLKQSVVHYASCSGVNSIHVVWSEPDPPSDLLHDFLRQATRMNSKDGKYIEVTFDLNQEDSLNNRFKEIKGLRTDAIFSIDDDVIFSCSAVELAFSVWQSAPMTMVGFVPRMHWLDKSRGSVEQYRYGGWWSVWWMGTYSMVLSKAAFFHKKYLDLYTNHMPVAIRDYVTKNRNCEDIAMSLLVANVTGAPPIWVKGRVFEIGSTGISNLGGHSQRRSQCLNVFAAIYDHMPLVATNTKVIDSRHSWFW